MNKTNRQNLPITILEFTLVLVMWLIIVITPLIIRNRGIENVPRVLFQSMIHIAPFFIFFLVNHLITVPKLLFNRRRVTFAFVSILLITLFSILQIHRENKKFKSSVRNFAVVKFQKKIFDVRYVAFTNSAPRGQKSNLISNDQFSELDDSIRNFESIKNENQPLYTRQSTAIFRLEPPPLVLENQVSFYMQKHESPNNTFDNLPLVDREFAKAMRPISYFSIMFMLVTFGLSTGIRVIFHWIKQEKESVAKENQSIKNELNFLKSQISPHFFMNTLNNIHSLIDIDPEKSQVAIVEFSKLMRYMLYDSETDSTDLAEEIEFLENYVSLMKLRFTDEVAIEIIKPDVTSKIPIAPLLFTSIVENSFKHGVSYQKKSFIKMEFIIEDGWISFCCANSNFRKIATERSGIGVENTKKRLDLIYKNRYELNIDVTDEVYTINVRIPYDKMHCNR